MRVLPLPGPATTISGCAKGAVTAARWSASSDACARASIDAAGDKDEEDAGGTDEEKCEEEEEEEEENAIATRHFGAAPECRGP
jgi:hypothetical protein